MTIEVDAYYTLIIASIVLLVGRLLIRKVAFLRDFNIPEPVAGGLVAAIVILILHLTNDLSFVFNATLQRAFMLIFFSSIGLGADFSRLKSGGKPLLIFLAVVSLFIIVQDLVGVGLAAALGLKPLIGLLTGSITLTGGHGTAGAWASVFSEKYGIENALTLGIASATFGLVAGGLLGGPVARRLIKKLDLHELPEEVVRGVANEPVRELKEVEDPEHAGDIQFEFPEKMRLITNSSAVETMALFAACLAFAKFMVTVAHGSVIDLPEFVWALGCGVVIRNVLTHLFNVDVFDRSINVFGNASLSLFLAMALLSLKVWELAGLAGPVVIILIAQAIVMALYATYVTYTIMGSDYDSSVLAAGHCGFGMGATPTAIANMQAITDKYGPSHKAFLIVPMVGAFFIDIINMLVIQGFLALPFLQ